MERTTFPDYPGQNGDSQNGYGNDQQNRQNNYGGGQQPSGNYGNGGSNNYGGNANNGGWQNRQGGNQGGWQGRQGGGNYGGNNGGWKGNRQGGGGGQWQGRQGGGGQWQRKPPEDLTLYKPYAVTGNPDAPPEIQAKVEETVKRLDNLGYTTRTGGLEGLETVAEKAASQKLELQLPFRGFNNKESKHTWSDERVMAVAKQFHPAFDGLSKGAQSFLGKNVRLILGSKAESPALFLIVWTEDGCESIKDRTAKTGFAGHPIAIASHLGIPVFNFARPDAQQRLDFYINSLPPVPSV